MKNVASSIGSMGEDIACTHIAEQGCVILARNYRYGQKEIDLIYMDGTFLVFGEVKARSSVQFGTPGAFVDEKKQRRIITAAKGYLQQNRLWDSPCRFDVIEVYLSSGRVTWIKDAFRL